jgi:EAL domain-containing protein (putative c-di-GMP-specific phosphodiesterase class I)
MGRAVFGYEAVIRGPFETPLHSPANLFATTERRSRLDHLELLCRAVNIRAFARPINGWRWSPTT